MPEKPVEAIRNGKADQPLSQEIACGLGLRDVTWEQHGESLEVARQDMNHERWEAVLSGGSTPPEAGCSRSRGSGQCPSHPILRTSAPLRTGRAAETSPRKAALHGRGAGTRLCPQRGLAGTRLCSPAAGATAPALPGGGWVCVLHPPRPIKTTHRPKPQSLRPSPVAKRRPQGPAETRPPSRLNPAAISPPSHSPQPLAALRSQLGSAQAEEGRGSPGAELGGHRLRRAPGAADGPSQAEPAAISRRPVRLHGDRQARAACAPRRPRPAAGPALSPAPGPAPPGPARRRRRLPSGGRAAPAARPAFPEIAEGLRPLPRPPPSP